MCDHGPGKEETTEHFLCHCVGYMTIRFRTLGNLTLTMEEIGNVKPTKIIEFVRQTRRFDKEDLFGPN